MQSGAKSEVRCVNALDKLHKKCMNCMERHKVIVILGRLIASLDLQQSYGEGNYKIVKIL